MVDSDQNILEQQIVKLSAIGFDKCTVLRWLKVLQSGMVDDKWKTLFVRSSKRNAGSQILGINLVFLIQSTGDNLSIL